MMIRLTVKHVCLLKTEIFIEAQVRVRRPSVLADLQFALIITIHYVLLRNKSRVIRCIEV